MQTRTPHEPDGDRRWAPLLPLALAERLRPILYTAGAALGAAGAAYALPVEMPASPASWAVAAGGLVAVWRLVRWLDQVEGREIPHDAVSARTSGPLSPAPVRYPPAHAGEAVRLAGAAYTGATMPLPLEVVRDE